MLANQNRKRERDSAINFKRKRKEKMDRKCFDDQANRIFDQAETGINLEADRESPKSPVPSSLVRAAPAAKTFHYTTF